MSRVIVHRNAAKHLQRLPQEIRERVQNALAELSHQPLQGPNVKHMVGDWAGYHRIRVGTLRIIFWYDKNEDIVYVDHVGPRGDIYK
ncbi:MAG: type II toxin-antitoxin system RelE/ParE family toxin [Deltaproteobacteria bacterium]|nr:type II toxin-antitoxin system RelE/ParE family toxin [Deltaproteobacteria bacterium]